jgi:hypothetical protein
MSLSFYDVSIPTYLHTLRNLAAILEKSEAHAKASGIDPAGWLEVKLAPDMLPFTRQIQMASDAAKLGTARLAGVTPPAFADTETTWAELKARIARTIAYIETISREQVDGGEGRTIELQLPGRTMAFTGVDFLNQFSLPNFFFHVVTAYALLRSQGAPLGKMDYLAGARAAELAA